MRLTAHEQWMRAGEGETIPRPESSWVPTPVQADGGSGAGRLTRARQLGPQ